MVLFEGTPTWYEIFWAIVTGRRHDLVDYLSATRVALPISSQFLLAYGAYIEVAVVLIIVALAVLFILRRLSRD
ncbi:MAG TPA: hypothetical protein EYN79_08685 [Planctomycetes bacterium]|nr:hypothetical protein [Planctomycetota bacterium]HIN80206.1 hypothetical protein [Planctomycetota bacterium]